MHMSWRYNPLPEGMISAISWPWAVVLGLFAALLVTAVVLLAVLLGREKSTQQRLEDQLRDAQEELRESCRRSFMSREETQNLLGSLSRQIMMETDETERRQQALFSAMDEKIERMDHAQESRSAALASAVSQRLQESDQQVEKLRETVDQSLARMSEENARALNQMRQTVDEKLQGTLEKRLSESFRLVSAQLENVSKGLGEMRTLAGGVGDLKKVLTNVKTRGTWGEIQLGALISQILTPGQYEENVAVVPDSPLRVEYAVVLPGRHQQKVYLPIDSKFPLSAYEQLVAESEAGDPIKVQKSQKALEEALLTEGKRISSKYVCPPHTTDFAVMFLPVEGLFAEAMRVRGLAEKLQSDYHVIPCGPTTLSALLSSLQVGFRTLAVEERSAEVWKMLTALQTDFTAFCGMLEAARSRMRQAAESIDRAAARSRSIESRLRAAEDLPAGGAPLPPEASPGQTVPPS